MQQNSHPWGFSLQDWMCLSVSSDLMYISIFAFIQCFILNIWLQLSSVQLTVAFFGRRGRKLLIFFSFFPGFQPKLSVHPGQPSSLLACLSGHRMACSCAFKMSFLKNVQPFWTPALQDRLPGDSINQSPKQVKSCPPEDPGSSSDDPLLTSSRIKNSIIS